mmetsp:Transcript_67329/g.78112  ORF Transcript_67329/g.78112 Transcript_67329/m.78112 type:complete len:238 (-) Transcript_67329:95-808(-)
MKTLVVLLAIFAVATAEQSIPIPPTVEGLLVGNANATFQIDAFIDLMCSDCLADWSTMKDVFNDVTQYGVSFRFHIFPLPYHTYAFLFATAANFFITQASHEDAMKFLDFAFSVQPQFYNDVVANLSFNQITQNVVNLAVAAFPNYNQSQLLDAFTNMDYNIAARTSWKYAAAHGVTGTPTFHANGIPIDGSDGFAYTDWINFLKQYVNIPNAQNLIKANAFKKYMRSFGKDAKIFA